jgi:hypothetical protein
LPFLSVWLINVGLSLAKRTRVAIHFALSSGQLIIIKDVVEDTTVQVIDDLQVSATLIVSDLVTMASWDLSL